MALPQEMIRRKRDGGTLGDDEIAEFVDGLTTGRITEGQVAAFAMAVFFNGMAHAETVALTRAMAASGGHLAWRDLDCPVLDKHSTGGVGDKVSLILAPVVAACGAYVPRISGRGLGHTGGTLDKMDSIPGYDTAPDLERLRAAVRAAGCAIVGQTEDLAPADRRLYAIRDVTATVESTPLIVASILSKKLAAGLDALVMDVKAGSGAFLPSLEATRDLARTLVEVANGAGLRCAALLTDMNQCLGRTAGNALEVREAIDLLRGHAGEPRLREVTLALAAELLVLGGVITEPGDAAAAVARALDSGAAAERFARMVVALGGPGDLLERPERHLPQAPVRQPVHLERAGVVAAIDVRALGLAVVDLGGGRKRAADAVDPRVGLAEVRGIGEEVGPDAPFAVVHAATNGDAATAAEVLRKAAEVVEAMPAATRPAIIERIAPAGIGLDQCPNFGA
jgi:thymidine phosphorylase